MQKALARTQITMGAPESQLASLQTKPHKLDLVQHGSFTWTALPGLRRAGVLLISTHADHPLWPAGVHQIHWSVDPGARLCPH